MEVFVVIWGTDFDDVDGAFGIFGVAVKKGNFLCGFSTKLREKTVNVLLLTRRLRWKGF